MFYLTDIYLTDIYAQAWNHLSLVLHTWSLAVEEQFYLVWPLVLVVCLRRRCSTTPLVVAT